MSSEMEKKSPEIDSSGMNLKETELTLGLPGESRGTKRGYADSAAAKPAVVGWPPVKATRKSVVTKSGSSKFVKVAVDGAPYLRKVDLEMYASYHQLLGALEQLFSCFTIRNYLSERKVTDSANGIEYVPTYEDRDGDWMLVGDVPWKMFVESCKRVRLMKSSDAIGLAPRTPSRCTSSS